MGTRRPSDRPIRVPRTRAQRERDRPRKKPKLRLKAIVKRRYFGRFPLWTLLVSGLLLVGAVIALFTITIQWNIVLMVLGVMSILVLAIYYIYMQKNY